MMEYTGWRVICPTVPPSLSVLVRGTLVQIRNPAERESWWSTSYQWVAIVMRRGFYCIIEGMPDYYSEGKPAIFTGDQLLGYVHFKPDQLPILARDIHKAEPINQPACGAPKGWRFGYLPCGCRNDGTGRHVF